MLALALQCSSTSRGRLGRTQSDAVAAAQPVAAVEWEGAGARRGRNLLTESDAAGRQTGRPEGPSGCCRAQKLAPLIANASLKLRRVVLWRWPADCSADPASPAALLRRLEADPVALGGYLADVYGSVAHAAGHTPPLGTLSFFWNSVPHRAEVVAPIAHHNVRSCFMAHGQPWVPWDGHEEGRFPGVFLARVEAALPKDDEWAEVMHVRRREEHRLRQDIASEGQFWYWLAPGSGIWLHVGKAMRVRTAGVYSPGCERAVEQGYDTILLSPSRAGVPPGFTRYGGAVEIVDCRGAQADRSSLSRPWEGPCPHPRQSQLRTGQPNLGGDRPGGSCECRCDASFWFLNCASGGQQGRGGQTGCATAFADAPSA